MSFHPAGGRGATEFSDKYTYRDAPGGRRYDFSIRFGDVPASRCLSEIREFVKNVAIPWFEAQAASHS